MQKNIKEFLTSWIKDNYDKLFIAILVIAFIIRIWIFIKTQNQPLWWDAADYLSTAKRWAGIELNNIWYYRRGFLWPLFSAFFFALGLGEKTIRLTEILFSTGIVYVSYFLIRDMFNKKIALLTSIGLTLSWILLFFTGRPLTSIPATFFLLTALFFFYKSYIQEKGNKYLYLFAAFYALSILTRMQYLLFAFPFIIYIFTKEKFSFLKNKKLWITLIVFLIILSPQIITYTTHYGNPITDIARYYFGISAIPSATAQTNQRTFSTAFNYLIDLPYILGGTQPSFLSNILSQIIFYSFLLGAFLLLVDLVLGFDKIFKNPDTQKKLFIVIWILTLFLVLGYITDYVEHRYVIPALPFIFAITSIPILRLSKYIKLNKKFLLILFIFIILLIPNLSWTNQLTETKKTSYIEVKQAGEWIRQYSEPVDIILSVSLPQTMYYSERPTYPFDVGSEQFRRRDSSLPTYGEGRQGFENFIQDKKPKYLVVSAFEPHPEWTQKYIDENKDKLNPVKVFNQGERTVLVIYEFQYSQSFTTSKT